MPLQKLAGAEMMRLSPEEFRLAPKHPIYVLLQNIRSMWNVGSIFRTSDAACIEELIITGYTATPPRKEIEKTALGATETVKWSYCQNPIEAIAMLRAKGVKIAALEIARPSRRYDAVQLEDFPICLVVGNEVTGIDDEVLAACDFALEIPQYGTKHSLNVAVAVGIAVFELVRVWRQYEGESAR
ncbi:MAG: RNA methyltransferase [Chloroherpetonaceae bacterium]|nr:RNA methyltransferase [Chloroherpetonaceae bacterium]MCS7211796.1 RNA methyltransferase [Chloroherpetonaceae bacterium]